MAKHQPTEEKDPIRLDKWLWAARFYKTRTLAKEMIDGGKVHYNGQRTKPNKIVEVGATLKLRSLIRPTPWCTGSPVALSRNGTKPYQS